MAKEDKPIVAPVAPETKKEVKAEVTEMTPSDPRVKRQYKVVNGPHEVVIQDF